MITPEIGTARLKKELDLLLETNIPVFIHGAPGIGKSTLMLQICQQLGKFAKVLYVSGEESIRQIRMRSLRLGASSARLFVVSEIDLEIILATVEAEKPDVLVIDSIQTMYNPELSSAPGSVSQVRESCASHEVRRQHCLLICHRDVTSIFLLR